MILGQSRDDRGLPGRRSRQRQGFPRRFQDREDRVEAENQRGSPCGTAVPDTLEDIGFMVRDSKRFADSGGWGYAQFNHDAASDTFAPDRKYIGTATCGFACHTIVAAKDYVFTAYGKR